MKALGGGGGSHSKTSGKAGPKTHMGLAKKAPAKKQHTHAELTAQWQAAGRDANGKLIKRTEVSKQWSKTDIERARAEAARAAEAAELAAKGPAPVDAGVLAEEAVAALPKATELARARMAELAELLQARH